MSEIREQIYDIIAKEGSIDRGLIRPDATMKDLNVESLDAVQIIFGIEETFQISVPYNDPAFDVDTVGGLVDTVEKLVAQKDQG